MFNKKLISLVLVFNIIIISTIFPVFSVSDNLTMESETLEEFEKFGDDLEPNDPDSYILNNKRRASFDEDFSLDRVTVILKHDYSEVNKLYIASNFDDSLFSEVEDLSYINKYSTEDEVTSCRVNIDEFHQILSLKLKTPGKENVLKAVEYLNTLDIVLAAEPEYIYKYEEDYTVNDASYNEQWGLEKIDIENAWNISRGSSTVKVGVFEEGIASHEDIDSSRISTGNLQYNSNVDYDHGTMVAGVLGATSNNNIGIAGVAQVSLVLLDSGNLASSLTYAANNDIYIINASFHYINENGTIAGYNSAHVAAIQNYPGLIVCAAGNRNANIDVSPQYPAAYSLDNIITVANTDEYDNLYIDTDGDENNYSSNYGATKVHLAAPGTDILTTFSDGEYITTYGTSLATPYVTGVAALLKSKYPTMDTKAIKDYILSNVDDITGLEDKVVTGGRLNAGNALTNLKKFYVNYDANGGGGTAMTRSTIIYGCVTPLSKNTYSKAGYTFKGWNAKRSDGTWYYTDGKWYTEGSQPAGYSKYLYRDEQKVARTATDGKTVTMYAKWEKKFNIEFVGNNATSGAIENVTLSSGVNWYIPSTGFSRNNCSLEHWYVKNSSDEHYCSNGTSSGWYAVGSKPSGYTRVDFSKGAPITVDDIEGTDYDETIYMCAYWKPNYDILGDINMDDNITITDVTRLQKYLSGEITFTAYQVTVADVNFDGSATVQDATMIQKYLAGTIDEFGA